MSEHLGWPVKSLWKETSIHTLIPFFLYTLALAMGLCVAMIAFVRLPSLKVSCLLLSGLLIYDVFWVSVNFLFSSEFS